MEGREKFCCSPLDSPEVTVFGPFMNKSDACDGKKAFPHELSDIGKAFRYNFTHTASQTSQQMCPSQKRSFELPITMCDESETPWKPARRCAK